MRWWMTKMRPLAGGAITLGILQAVQNVDFNYIWYQFLTQLLSTLFGAIVMLLTGGNLSEILGSDTGSFFGSFFV